MPKIKEVNTDEEHFAEVLLTNGVNVIIDVYDKQIRVWSPGCTSPAHILDLTETFEANDE
jgi:hypothetical protein